MEFSSVNTIWVLLGAALVFFMQAGFSMCEAGFTRAKNTGNILMKNLMDFCIGTPCFWLVGFGIMFGAGTGLFGWFDSMIMKDYSSILPSGVPLWAYAIFQTVFCATSATIVSGAMAERTKFSAYCIYSAAISLLIYPISGHWIWGGGWLSELGFHDFAGSTCVHMVGGVCALIGAKMLGPRIGKYGKDGKPRAILGHNLTFAALGVFILWFCWFGFNGASTVGMDTDELIVSAGLVFFNTNLCTAVACCTTLIFTWLRYGKPDVSMTYNAALAGLVGITIVFAILKHTIGLRVTPEEEITGLDVSEHGLLTAYAGFAMLPDTAAVETDAPVAVTGSVPAAEAIPVKRVPSFDTADGTSPKFTKVEIICKESKFEALKTAMLELGITGMTMSHVLGCGIQKGKPEYYRGVEVEPTLLPKIQLDIVVSKVPVRSVIETAKKVLYTGHIGDGKIFVYDVENVVKVRTGEEGYDALQDVE